MAIHYIEMDVGDKLGDAGTGTDSQPSSGGTYSKQLCISWDTANVDHIGQIYDAVDRILDYMESSNDHTNGSVGGGVAGCKGYRTTISHDPSLGEAGGGMGVDYVGIGSTNNSILLDGSQVANTGFDVAVEGNTIFQNSGLPQTVFIDLTRRLREALMQTSYPLA